uniref:HPr serine kinase domain protein n=1 Tax=Rhodopseudomonas palustris (strain DX-1) TaxID=652103 RepID=E6VFG0_RHOPX
MRIFISWSGDLSKALAEVIRNWLPSALQYVKPYFSPSDIEKGSKRASEIFKELSTSSVCIIVLTRDNLNSNWIMFEAGAISCTIDHAKVCPIIFNLDETDLQGPLAQFQTTKFLRQDIRSLFFTINSAAGDKKLSDSVLTAVFDKWWPDLEGQVVKILDAHKASKSTTDIRSERDLIEELLLLTRKMSAEVGTSRATENLRRGGLASSPALLKYETSLYKSMMDLVQDAFDLGNFEDDELAALKRSIDTLITTVSAKSLVPVLKTGLIDQLSRLSLDVQRYIESPS